MNNPGVDQTLDLEGLRAENARLIALLERHGIEWRLPQQPIAFAIQEQESSQLSTTEKLALFRQLFRGRTDVYPICRESKTTGKSGYTPYIDFVDTGHPALLRMWHKRQAGYRAMGYRVGDNGAEE